ncbi:1-deoxy-D-xylulose-5-phosphate synthase [[Eubacterium] hominis]|uniref:1-deoxy-D-xylulose-5-phosphate synthase n=1 Tax=[Eubacterium] hominis TaxID=2764325 RepID=UPI003A4D8593
MNIHDIKQPNDIKTCSIAELEDLCDQIRCFLIESVAKTGGHLSSNLGIVELTVAMHYVFHTPQDKFLFDVGHQSYVHKILTGRVSMFPTLRQYKGLAGFQKRCESEHDAWEAGHSSTSLSGALGMAIARDLNKEDYEVVPVIGDGALSGGMAMEALNQIGALSPKMVIIFNDNNMSISKNVGAMDEAFTRLRTSRPYNNLKEDLKGALSNTKTGSAVLKSMRSMKNAVKANVVDTSIFGDFNLDYIGPVDGHDLRTLIKVLEIAKKHDGPIVVHVMTKKGKGYSYAEEDKEGKWHGVSQFDPQSGQTLAKMPAGHLSWSEVISKTLVDLAAKNEHIVGITPAMIGGSKLQNFFDAYPDRAFDCGIAEEHAMTFAAGLATSGIRPFVSVYSSFLQRAYDQINHDIARMDLPVVIGIDRCSLVGEDGDTHHGVFDIAMLRSIPNMILSQPKDATEAQNLMYTAFQQQHPFAIRYPRGNTPYQSVHHYEQIELGSWTSWEMQDYEVIIITYGNDVDRIISKVKVNQLPVRVVNARFFKPIDSMMLEELCAQEKPIIIYEADMMAGGLSSAILEYVNDHKLHQEFIRLGIDDHYVTHGSLPQLRKLEHLDMNSLCELIVHLIGGKNHEA